MPRGFMSVKKAIKSKANIKDVLNTNPNLNYQWLDVQKE
jgi:hypothetical protein